MQVDIAAKLLTNMKDYADLDDTECEAVDTLLAEILHLKELSIQNKETINKLNELNMKLNIENESLKLQLTKKQDINKAIDTLSKFSFNKTV